MSKYLLILIFMLFISVGTFAQEVQKYYKYSAEELAQKKIDKLAPELNLTTDQQKILYDEFVNYIKNRRDDDAKYGTYGLDYQKKMRKERMKELKNSLKQTLTKAQLHKFIKMTIKKNK